GAILLGIHGQFLHWNRKTGGNKLAGKKSTEQKQRSRAANLPAQPMLPRDRIGQWINTYFIGRRKERIRVTSPVKQKMGCAINNNHKAVLGPIRSRNRIRYFGSESRLRALRERRQVQSAICPNAAFDSRADAPTDQFQGFEANHERGNDFTGF